MSSRLPVRVDPWRLADQGKLLEGCYALAGMRRLAPLLVDAGGECRFRLGFGRDTEGRAVIQGEVDAVLVLTCQRCLEPLEHKVQSCFTLGVVTSIAEAKRLPDSYESLLADEDSISPRDVVEEELLLSVPAVPRHDQGCPLIQGGDGAGPGGEVEPAASPFAELAGMVRRGDDD